MPPSSTAITAFPSTPSPLGWEEAGAAFVSVNPKQRFGESHEVASLIAFLLSDGAEFINGAVVPIDGGQSQAY
jgi:NAD(P)-dependent dehydrogenase (short-subunit alcohol dehydrogenase family)